MNPEHIQNLIRDLPDNHGVEIRVGDLRALLAERETLRDRFAMAAVGSVTAPCDYSTGPCNHAIAVRAYLIADAMLAARKATQ